MERGNRISSIFCLLFSLIMVREAYRLELGSLLSPQAGFLPFFASILLGILSLMLLLSVTRRKLKISEKNENITFNVKTLPQLISVIASLFLYTIFLNILGFILATMILIGFLLRAVEPQKWYVVMAGGISIPLIAYLIFDVLLKVQLPKGFLGF
jgi:putative tricarboxylic transport membrane protein